MIRGLYTAATGMNAMQTQLDVISNNIANVNTIAFKKDRAEFEDLMYETLNYTAGQTSNITRNPTGIDVGLGTKVSGIQKAFLEGDLSTTGNNLDLAIKGEGFFKVTLPNGDIAYTRGGAFKLDNERNIVNAQGYPLDPQINIPEDYNKITIAQNGIVTAQNSNGDTQELGQITTSTFPNNAGLRPLGENLYQITDASGNPVDGNPGENQFGSLQQGTIELSNVKLVEEMVNLITAQRAYEANSKVITSADSMLDTVNNLKR